METTNERFQVLFALADRNGDGLLSVQEVKQLFDQILISAQIDPVNEYQGLAPAFTGDLNTTINLQQFIASMNAWWQNLSQNVERQPNALFILTYISVLTDQRGTASARQVVDRIVRAINNMEFETAYANPVNNLSTLPIAQEVDVTQLHHSTDNIPIANVVSLDEPVTPPPPPPETKVEQPVCAICIEPLTSDSEYGAKTNEAETLPCVHTFHHDCLNEMRRIGSNTCPMCRAPFQGGRKKKRRRKTNKKKLKQKGKKRTRRMRNHKKRKSRKKKKKKRSTKRNKSRIVKKKHRKTAKSKK